MNAHPSSPKSSNEIVWLPIENMRPYERNARTHSDKQLRMLAASIRQFGFTSPVLVDETGMILAGHGRVEAAKLLGLETAPTLRIEGLSAAEKRAYILADNRIAERAGWDRDLLRVEFEDLVAQDLSFNVELSGFETAEIDLILDDHKRDDADEVPPARTDGPAVTRAGDLWRLGRHRLLCADATKAESYQALLNEERAQMVFTDPPYNVPIEGHVSGLGQVQHREFAMASGEMSAAQFTTFLATAFRHMADFTQDGAIHFICMDWRHLGEVLEAGKEAYAELKNLIVWAKTNAGMGSFYRSQHELVLAFKNGAAPHINNFGLGENGRYRSNVWTYAGANSFKPGRHDELAMHPTVKPVELVADAIRDCSKRNGVILDPFAGSGTTVIAAEKTGRIARALELDPHYCDVIVRRWQDWSGEPARHGASNQTFEEAGAARAVPASNGDNHDES